MTGKSAGALFSALTLLLVISGLNQALARDLRYSDAFNKYFSASQKRLTSSGVETPKDQSHTQSVLKGVYPDATGQLPQDQGQGEETALVAKPKGPVVAVFPFFNSSSSHSAAWRVWCAITDYLSRRGFRPIPRQKIIDAMELNRMFPNVRQTPEKYLEVSRSLKADLTITGQVRHFGTDRRFRIGALVTGGVVLYGTVELDMKVHLTPTGEVFWEREASWTKKRQVMGFLQASSDAVDEALQRTMAEVMGPFVDRVILKGLPEIPGDAEQKGDDKP